MKLVVGLDERPTHKAVRDTIFTDRYGITWRQVGFPMGCLWEPFRPHGAPITRIFSSDGMSQFSAVHSSVAHSVVSPNTNTGDYFTWFPVKRTLLVYGLILPLQSLTAGQIDLKACLYVGFPSNVYTAYKPVDSRFNFTLSHTVTAKEDILIPFTNVLQEPLILRPWDKYYLRSIWGSQFTGNVILRHPFDRAGGGTGGNNFRTDRERASGINYTTDPLTETFTSAAAIGSGSGSTSMGRIDWGFLAEVLD